MLVEKNLDIPEPAQRQWVMPTNRWDHSDLFTAFASLLVPLERRFMDAYNRFGSLKPESLITSIYCQSEETINRAIESFLKNNPSAIRFVA